jgi:glucose-1-phosphate adenylyltransferase
MALGKRVLSMVLAGGEGKRLMPLTRDRAKPAVPFGGHYRLIDFALSNLVNAGYRHLAVLTQYKSHSLDRHITLTWRMSTLLGNYVVAVPAQQRLGPRWYVGSADAIYQSLNLIHDEDPEYVVVFGADHIYRMDVSEMVAQHIESGAGVTVAGIRTPRSGASEFGIIQTDNGRDIAAFLEKPADPPGLPDSPDESFASMGNYVFTTEALLEALRLDSLDEGSKHDMGANIIPRFVDQGAAQVYDFAANDVPGSTERDRAYWRDVGTIDAYYESHLDLVSAQPVFNLYNRDWPIYTFWPQRPPAKFVDGGCANESLISDGCLIAGSSVVNSVLSPDVTVMPGAQVDGAVLINNVTIGADARIGRVILDKNVKVPDGARIGIDPDEDRMRGYTVSEGGVTVLGKNDKILP